MCWRSHVHKVLKSNIIDISKRWPVWVTWGRGRSSVLNENLVDAGRPEESLRVDQNGLLEMTYSLKLRPHLHREKFVAPG